MRMFPSRLGLVATLALTGVPAPAAAQPVGSEFQINTRTTDSQFGPSVASDANGNFVVVWVTRYEDDLLDEDILGQRFDSAGAMLGSEFQVNTFRRYNQDSPSVAAAPGGDFIVVWASNGQDGSQTGVFAQRYDSAGNTLGGEFRVNSSANGSQGAPAVATDSTGNFIVVWSGDSPNGPGSEVSGQRYDSMGVPIGGEFHVNSYTTSAQSRPAIAIDPSGGFVVVWESRPQDGDLFGIFGQRFDSGGNRRGAEFSVNTYTTLTQINASVASVAGGGFVVVWNSQGQDGSSFGVFARRYDSAGNAQGPEFRVNTYTTGSQIGSSIASDASGFIVAWGSPQDGDGDGVFGQRYDSGGVAQGDEFQINSYTTGVQGGPRISTTNINQFVVAWYSAYQDGDLGGIFGQRLDFAGDTITVVSPNTNVKWRIGSQQKIQWTHNLGADATFRIELDRDDDGDYEELIAAGAPVDSATKGSFGWVVTGPPSGAARVRVSWTDDLAISDASDAAFQIRPVGLETR